MLEGYSKESSNSPSAPCRNEFLIHMATSKIFVIPVLRRYWLYALGPLESAPQQAILRWQDGVGLEEKIERMGHQLSAWVREGSGVALISTDVSAHSFQSSLSRYWGFAVYCSHRQNLAGPRSCQAGHNQEPPVQVAVCSSRSLQRATALAAWLIC